MTSCLWTMHDYRHHSDGHLFNNSAILLVALSLDEVAFFEPASQDGVAVSGSMWQSWQPWAAEV